jgi:hypothetical protein
MTILRIVAHINCDRCGKLYHTLLDAGDDNVFDSAVNGRAYWPDTKEYSATSTLGPSVSYEDGEMRCVACTIEADESAASVEPHGRDLSASGLPGNA